MEWVETTAKSLDEAREQALDQLGVGIDDAEFEVLEEPKQGLFGRTRGTARLRARVRPTPVRPKQDRRRRRNDRGRNGKQDAAQQATKQSTNQSKGRQAQTEQSNKQTTNQQKQGGGKRQSASRTNTEPKVVAMSNDQQSPADDRPAVSPDEVGAAAVRFVDGLTEAFGVDATSTLQIDGTELDVAVSGAELGLLVGPGGRTLNAVQDLARVASQRRLGDHDTRLRIDVAGYRARREEALERFARDVAGQVRSSGVARSLEPMTSADRKVIHDVLNDEDGVQSRSEGEDPQRRIVVDVA
ncbi:MAG: Jag N-terminal domain-containing protein [Ilumatobacteraceae bacterium]|nr:Jag N-terminal domain-containing protein [Ilumatobacteraceae bacterium]